MERSQTRPNPQILSLCKLLLSVYGNDETEDVLKAHGMPDDLVTLLLQYLKASEN